MSAPLGFGSKRVLQKIDVDCGHLFTIGPLEAACFSWRRKADGG
jgi:hypothetical protein